MNFRVDGKVQAKQSLRFSNVNGFVKKYTPKKMVAYANWVKICFKQKYPNHRSDSFLDKALIVRLSVYFEIPKSYSKKKQALAQAGTLRPTVKPDCDNIAKNILDALNGLAYPDDKQIVTLIVDKKYAQIPFVEVTVNEVMK